MCCFCLGRRHWAHMLLKALSWTKSGPEPRANNTKLGGQPRNIRNVAPRQILACFAPTTPAWPHGADRYRQVSRGFEPRTLDSESRVLTVTPRDHLNREPVVDQKLESHWIMCWFCSGGNTGRACCSRPCPGPNRGESREQTARSSAASPKT